jgi:hypothetical protein
MCVEPVNDVLLFMTSCRAAPNADGDRPHERTYNAPSAQEIASFQPDGGLDPLNPHRAVVAQGRNGNTSILKDTDPHSFPLRFPLLNPFGDVGWHPKLRHHIGTGKLTAQDWAAFMLQYRPGREGPVSLDPSEGAWSSHLLLACRLLQEFVVDMHSQVEGARLNWVRFNQSKLRSDVYRGLQDAVNAGETRIPHILYGITNIESFRIAPHPLASFGDCFWTVLDSFISTAQGTRTLLKSV